MSGNQRNRTVWTPVDLGGLTMDEFIERRSDISSRGKPRGGGSVIISVHLGNALIAVSKCVHTSAQLKVLI